MEITEQIGRRFKPTDSGFTLVNPIRQAALLVILMLLTPWASADISTWEGPTSSPDDAGINPSNSTYDGFSIPTNATITGSEFNVAPKWTPAQDNGSLWAASSIGGFSSGEANGTSYLTSNGDLTLAPISTYGEMTDFETSDPQFGTWSTQGDDFWMPVNLSLVTYGPENATSGDIAAGTNGSIIPGSSGYVRSQFWPVPNVVRYFNLTFDRWNSFDTDDVAELQYSIDSGQNWQMLDNWSGVTSDWVSEAYSLDNLTQNATDIGFRFYVGTSINSSNDIGLFVDSFNISNQGEPVRSWFHGNISGQYSPNADGTLIVPVDLSGLTAPLEFSYWANWDIQGGNYDNLVVMISQDNGSTWTIMSPLPGVPGQGIPSAGSAFTQQSFGWRELLHPFPSWAANHVNAANTLLKFRVTTDGSFNYGGSGVDGWEGIMIDDLKVMSAVGSPSMQTRLLQNFTSNSSQYLVSVQGYDNDWEYIDWEGHNGPWSDSDSFEVVQGLPSGWRINHIRGASTWERGAIDNSNGFGPNSTVWPSGVKGMGIDLDDEYTNHVYTHLISPVYKIPTGATARLTFNHWICTEAAWDGGSVYTSVDDGITWQPFGQNITGFYERISQVNTNSPFFGLGIFDGSTVPNGCGTANSNHTFSRVSGDISDLAGNDVRIRFSFFSDTFVEEDGWYIDDAGIVIDRFSPNGTWVSPLITADSAGWARLTALYESPLGTNISIDVLDVNGEIIEGHENRTLPFDLDIATWEYPQIKFRAKFTTDNETLTPRIKILHHGITEYFNHEILKRIDPNAPDWVFDPNVSSPLGAQYNLLIQLPLWRPFSEIDIECEGNVSATINSIPDRIPTLNTGYPTSTGTQNSVVFDSKECGERLVNTFGPARAMTFELVIEAGEEFEWIKLEPATLLAPINPSIDFGDDGIIDWMWNGTFHHTNELYSLEIDGLSVPIFENRGFEINYSDSLNFSILLPSRNLSTQSWGCGLNFLCYNGGINYQTNNSQYPIMDETHFWLNKSGITHHMTEYQFKFTTNQLTSFKLHSINYYSGFTHSIIINTSLAELFVENQDQTSSLPVTISSQRGGIIFDGEISHEKSIVDSWVSLPTQTFIPGLIQTAVSSHQVLAGTPDLESINVKISSSLDIEDTFVEVTVDNLESGGRFIQNSGAGIIVLDSNNCSWDGMNVTWSLESNWLLDDYSRLYWFVSGTNLEGLSLGPLMGTSGTAQYAASTNDLEVVSFKAWSSNRALHDMGNPLWPLNVKGGEEITVEGKVRFSGLNGNNPLPEDVDVVIEIQGQETITNSTTSIDSSGNFNTTLLVPSSGLTSGEEVKIKPLLQNIGSEETTTALDVTSTYQSTNIVLDMNNSQVVSLEINAPGGNQPADGHIWHPGQDIPLQLHVIDDNGLPSKMELFYNRSGRNWESIEFLTPVGSTSAIIDLPLIDEASVPLPNEEIGWLDVYIQGFDLAGNILEGGGSAQDPYATIHVQPRYSTWINGESIALDRYEGQLLPGNTHKFNFTISDDNGLESIDRISLDLSKNQDFCDIDWIPWSEQVINDAGCFIKPPRVEAVQRWQANTWDVTVYFELRWDLVEDVQDQENVPSLRLWDENAPLGAGFTSINLYSWTIHSGIELEIIDAVDKVAPLGEFIDGIMYIHGQDIVDIEVVAYHMGTDIPAHNLPFTTSFVLDIIGNNASTQQVNSFNSDGQSIIRIVFDSALYGTQIKLLVNLDEISGHNSTGNSIDVLIDESSPTILVSSGYLVSVDSNELSNVPVQVTMLDDQGLTSNSILMHWMFIHQGRIVEQSQGSAEIPVQFQSVRSNLYSAIVDMNTSSELQKGDSIIVWFSGSDAAGRAIIGTGTSEVEPISTFVRWIAYEPTLSEIVTTPYRPSIGDIIIIQCQIVNPGVLDGNSSLVLYDGDGRVLDMVEFNLSSEMILIHTFEVEAWKIGDLGLNLQLDTQNNVPVPISNVQSRTDDSTNSQTVLLGLASLSVFIAALLLIFANNRRNENLAFDEEE